MLCSQYMLIEILHRMTLELSANTAADVNFFLRQILFLRAHNSVFLVKAGTQITP